MLKRLKKTRAVSSAHNIPGWLRIVVRTGQTAAVAHSMLIAVFFVLKGAKFKDLGADYYNKFNRERKILSHVRQLSKLGVAIPGEILQGALLPPLDPRCRSA